jgi:type IV secretion system protein VirB5
MIAIDVTSVIRVSPSSFRVEWIEHHYEDSGLAGTSRWTAILTVVIHPISLDQARFESMVAIRAFQSA